MAARTGSAEWHGDLKSGNGKITAGEGSLSANYSFTSRFEDGEGTNPEELIGAALAGCFSMALASDLDKHDHTPESVSTKASVFIRNIDGTPTIQRIELETEGRVAGIDEAHFIEHAESIKEGCIISRALGAVEEIVVTARLVS